MNKLPTVSLRKPDYRAIRCHDAWGTHQHALMHLREQYAFKELCHRQAISLIEVIEDDDTLMMPQNTINTPKESLTTRIVTAVKGLIKRGKATDQLVDDAVKAMKEDTMQVTLLMPLASHRYDEDLPIINLGDYRQGVINMPEDLSLNDLTCSVALGSVVIWSGSYMQRTSAGWRKVEIAIDG